LSDASGFTGGPIILLDERRFYMLDYNTAAGFSGRPMEGVIHWLVGGGEARIVRRWLLTDVVNDFKGNPQLVRRLTVGGRHVLVYRFPPYPAGGVNGSHWAAVVRVGNELVFASVHGRRFVDAAVAMAADLAEQASATPPSTGFPMVVHDLDITYCGLLSFHLNGVRWRAASAAEPTGPYRWRQTEIGTFTILSPEHARFRTRSGTVTNFVRVAPGTADLARRCD
jgi:hypothetical protein